VLLERTVSRFRFRIPARAGRCAAEIIEQERLSRSWGGNTKACLQVAEALLNSGCERFKRRFPISEYRTPSQDNVGAPRKRSEQVLRLAETIRRQVRRYRARHSNWRRDFDLQAALLLIELSLSGFGKRLTIRTPGRILLLVDNGKRSHPHHTLQF